MTHGLRCIVLQNETHLELIRALYLWMANDRELISFGTQKPLLKSHMQAQCVYDALGLMLSCSHDVNKLSFSGHYFTDIR